VVTVANAVTIRAVEVVPTTYGASRTPAVVARADSETEWDDFVRTHPDASGYHSWRWRHIFDGVFGHRCEYLIARRNREVVGVLPLVVFHSRLFGRFAVSLPFVNDGGVVANDADAARALLARAIQVARAADLSHLELRHRSRLFEDLPCKEHKVSMTLPLPPSTSTAWDGLDRKVRNQVRKAEKSELVVEAGGRNLIPAFYRVFAHNMRDLGTPVYSRRLFEAVCTEFSEETRVFLVRHQRTTVAAGIAYRHRDSVEVPWASSLAAYRTMCPNNLLYWRVIEWAIGEGLRVLDFGRSTPFEGTYKFKQQWGAQPRQLYWEYWLDDGLQLPDHSPKNPRFGAAIAVWRRLPVAVSRVIGPTIVRNIP
jgi:FemAB-related protein (PEP-CTERM system-associated)